MDLNKLSEVNGKLRLYFNNLLFMNRVETSKFNEVFDEFYKSGMNLEGANGFDLFDEFALGKGYTLNKTPIVIHEGNSPLTKLYGVDAVNEADLIIKELKNNSNFAFTPKYISTGVSFTHHKCEEIMKEEFRKPSLKVVISEAFGMAAMVN